MNVHVRANEVLLEFPVEQMLMFTVGLFVYHRRTRKFVRQDVRGASCGGPLQLLSCHSAGVTRSVHPEHLFYVRLPAPGNRCIQNWS